MEAQWRVAAILNESLADTMRFAAWYLTEGAHSLLLFFDDPRDPAIAILGDHPRIECVPCTPAFWEGIGIRPDARFVKRQNAALTHAYRNTAAPWFLNVDADEFLFVRGRSIGAFLAEQDRGIEGVRVETAEVVAAPGRARAQFRLPMPREAARRVYREHAPLFGPRRMGLIGHPQGKSATRTGIRGAQVRQHWVERRRAIVNERRVGRREGCFLLHMIGLDYATWRAKLDWRSASRGFTVPLTERIAAARRAADPEARLRELHAAMHVMDEAMLERLAAEGAHLELDFDPDARVRAVFGTDPP